MSICSDPNLNISLSSKTLNDINSLIDKKIVFFQDVIQKTILYVQKNKILDILGVSDVSNCVNILFELSKELKSLIHKPENMNTEDIINQLQNINNELSTLLKSFGTELFEDLLTICFGNNSINTYTSNELDKCKFELIKKYFHPTSYKMLVAKKENEKSDKMIKTQYDEQLNEKSRNLDSINISVGIKSFHLKVYGMQLIIHNNNHSKSLIITGIVDDVVIDILNNKYIHYKFKQIHENLPNNDDFKNIYFQRFLSCMHLKDLFIYNSADIYSKYIGYITNINLFRTKNISQTIKEFTSGDLYFKREIIIQLLIYHDKYENQYLAYLLYDILSNDGNGNVDTQEQIILFDSFPWIIKQYFRDAMKKTVQYTNDLSNYDIQKIPIEQQICLLKANDSVKEKAMQKLKEVKSKSDDSGSKARQYLDGLLKIPFHVYKKEPILHIMEKIKNMFCLFMKNSKFETIEIKETYTSLEISSFIKKIKKSLVKENDIKVIKKQLTNGDKGFLQEIISIITQMITQHNLLADKPNLNKNQKKEDLKNIITDFVEFLKTNYELLEEFKGLTKINNINETLKEILKIEKNYKLINEYMTSIKQTLDDAVYGHEKAKKQVSRIIGQWINGEQDGYCFGFEGPPGVGKTSLAKRGLSNCLKDENGVSRPFAMIQIGGDSNGSSLHGHNYTYVGSTWGSIVQILMDKKCMNPIIFIDEVDKISKTEHGKEMVGILTHLLDPTQNDCFQDKYFTGIDLDLSKALFILSYNDVDAIDRVLLDRIHRIKFSNLSLEDKLVICNKHILPEVYKKMGLEKMIQINNEVLKTIIDEYTSEPGVRKLKEILFEIVGEINLDILNHFDNDYVYPINITMEDIKQKYFKDKHEIVAKKIHSNNRIGFINGLWANSLGQGGVIPIQCNYYPSDGFLKLKLTGMQGDVMKESMNVALTVAWNLTNKKTKDIIIKNHKHDLNGLHIHCPEGSVPKDGPSAGAAIATTIYSLFNNRKIKYNIAITGEISLDGSITEIGGLYLKILGGIKSGVTEFIYPKENERDYQQFLEKYKNNILLEGIIFHKVETIQDVFEVIFE